MPIVSPSTVVSYIERAFGHTLGGGADKPFSVHRQNFTLVSALISMVNHIPEQLLVMDGQTYGGLVAAVSALESAVAGRDDNLGGQATIKPLAAFGNQNAVALIYTALRTCPDQVPAQHVAGLEFLADKRQQADLRADMTTVSNAVKNAEWKTATVIAGSVVEALLLWAIQQKDPTALASAVSTLRAQKKFTAKSNDPENWGLQEYTEVASALQIISEETRSQCKLAQGFRNFVHPGKVERLSRQCNRATALSAEAAIEHVVNDLSSRFQ